MIAGLFLMIVFWNNRQESEALEIIDQMPQLIGGINTLASKMKCPKIARKAQIEGRVSLRFTVDKMVMRVVPKSSRGLAVNATRKPSELLLNTQNQARNPSREHRSG